MPVTILPRCCVPILIPNLICVFMFNLGWLVGSALRRTHYTLIPCKL